MAKVVGGDKFQTIISELAEKLDRPGTVRVGFLENATYPNGTKVALVAALNEYGHMVSAKNSEGEVGPSYFQLPRPFFRNMINAKQGEWPAAIAGLLKSTGYNIERTLQQTGEGVAGQLRQSITDFTSPPLAPSTIKAKGFDKPLVDTGHMLNSIAYEVKV
jgi:hypothetical protein